MAAAIADGKLTRNWHDFLAVHNAATAAADPHTWLKEWKKAAPDRTISLETAWFDGLSRSGSTEDVLSAWEGLGLSGRPEFELGLHDGFRTPAIVYLGGAEPKALIMQSSLGSSGHWLDQITVEAPICLTVDRQGNFERHAVAERESTEKPQ